MADALEDRMRHLNKFLEPGEKNLRRKMHKNRPQLLVAGPFILHDNARPHIVDVVTNNLRDYGWEVLPHASYNPDMSPQDLVVVVVVVVGGWVVMVVVAAVVLGFTTLLTSQVISVAFYSEREKSDRFCSEAVISV